MNFKGHSVGGIISATVVTIGCYTTSQSIQHSILYGITTYLFSLYPDLDIKSKSQKIWLIIGIIISGYLMSINDINHGFVMIGIFIIPQLFKHRGIVHTLKFGAVISYAWYYVLYGFINIDLMYTMVSGMIGYTTHLLLDKHIKL